MHSAAGISFIASNATLQEVQPEAKKVAWSESLPSLEGLLQEGEQVFHPLYLLTPEDKHFSEEITVIAPACVGVRSVWITTASGWERMSSVDFGDGYVELPLPHFCTLMMSGHPAPLKSLGFLKPSAGVAKMPILHIGCTNCKDYLTAMLHDEDCLLEYERCEGIAHIDLGMPQLEISQAGGGPSTSQNIALSGSVFPILSDELQAAADGFQVNLGQALHTFQYKAPAIAPAPSSSGASESPMRSKAARASDRRSREQARRQRGTLRGYNCELSLPSPKARMILYTVLNRCQSLSTKVCGCHVASTRSPSLARLP